MMNAPAETLRFKDSAGSKRFAIRLAFLAIACVLLWPAIPWESAQRWVLRASAFTGICSAIAMREFGAGAGIGVLVSAIALLRRRWFCRYVCPAGLVLEWTSASGFRKTSWWSKCPHIGRYAALVTLAGSVVGYPLFLWMDPLALFSSAFAARMAASMGAGVLAGIGMGFLLLLSLTSGGVWCARLCPLGGWQELLASARSLWPGRMRSEFAAGPGPAGLARRGFIIAAAGIGMGWLARRVGSAQGENVPLRPPGAADESHFSGLCLRCGNCVRTCPSKIIRPDTGQAGILGLLAPVMRYETDYCREDCRACTAVCPSGAITELDLEKKRRHIIGEALVDGSLCIVVLGLKDCDACARACPFDAIRIHWDEEQYVAYPLIDTDKCNGCGACEAVCPTGEARAIRVWRRID